MTTIGIKHIPEMLIVYSIVVIGYVLATGYPVNVLSKKAEEDFLEYFYQWKVNYYI